MGLTDYTCLYSTHWVLRLYTTDLTEHESVNPTLLLLLSLTA